MTWKSFLWLSVFLCLLTGRLEAKELLSFKGSVNLQSGQFTLDLDMPENSSIKASGVRMEDDYRLTMDVEHLQSPFFELSSKIESSLAFNSEKGTAWPSILGKLSSHYSLVDYKPAKELSGYFEIKGDRLYFNSLSFGDIGCNGFIELSSPYTIDMTVALDAMPMESFLDFWARDNSFDSSGEVSGEIKLSGTLDTLTMRGNLQAVNGHVEKLKYDSIQLSASGIYPMIHVAHSVISKSDGFSFLIDGPVDISDKANFKKQVKALKISPIVNETASASEWTIKKVDHTDIGSTEFKYLLRKKAPGGAGAHEEESAMLGIEQKLEF